jgi:hemerythrin-like domain-containing protein
MIQIGQKPSPTFQQPLELLSDCHRRIENFLGALGLVGERAANRDLTGQEREALATALRYFREAAPKHTADEEESLFPRMRSSEHPLARGALESIRRLEADHEATRGDHEAIDQIGLKWLEAGRLPEAERAEFCERVARLRSLYQAHIQVEDHEVFPAAAKILGEADLLAMGREMAARRQGGR